MSRYEHLIKHRLSIHRQEDTIHELRPEALIPNLDRIDYINRMKNRARLVVYLGMGWSGIVAMPELNEKLASGALQLILLGNDHASFHPTFQYSLSPVHPNSTTQRCRPRSSSTSCSRVRDTHSTQPYLSEQVVTA